MHLSSPFVLLLLASYLQSSPESGTARIIHLLNQARQRSHKVPALSPMDAMLQGTSPALDANSVQEAGFPVIVWTVNEPGRMQALLKLGIRGIISDRPDLLQKEVLAAGVTIDVQGHRGGRDLRPENTLPAFESGLDNLITTIETDTGVTKDHASLISHEQFINPQTCRTADGTPYTTENQIWTKDIDMADAAKRFICDKVFRGPQQKNDLSLSPVAISFAKEYKMESPYSPTNAAQLFEFASYYASYYRSGPGKANPAASQRAANADKVRFNLETKITPQAEKAGHTFSPQVFADTLAQTIQKHHMEDRADIQSFDFRTLKIVETQFQEIRTSYLMESLAALDR